MGVLREVRNFASHCNVRPSPRCERSREHTVRTIRLERTKRQVGRPKEVGRKRPQSVEPVTDQLTF
jgi:hypothetical protein